MQQIGGSIAMYFTFVGLLRAEDLKKYVRMFQKEKLPISALNLLFDNAQTIFTNFSRKNSFFYQKSFTFFYN
jgi:hypothetical protein